MPIKFFAIVIVFFFLIISLHAQLEKGNKMVGANVGNVFFNSGSSDVSFPAPTQGFTFNSTSFGVNISPSIGWFLSDNTVIGATLTINPSNQKNTYEAGGNTFRKDKSNTYNLGMGGFARNYFHSSSTFNPFGHIGLNFGFSSLKAEGFNYGSTEKQSYDGKSAGGFFVSSTLLMGLTKLLNSNTGLDLFAGYNFSYNKNTNKTTTITDLGNDGSIDFTAVSEPTTKFTNHGFVLGVGFQVFLDGRK